MRISTATDRRVESSALFSFGPLRAKPIALERETVECNREKLVRLQALRTAPHRSRPQPQPQPYSKPIAAPIACMRALTTLQLGCSWLFYSMKRDASAGINRATALQPSNAFANRTNRRSSCASPRDLQHCSTRGIGVPLVVWVEPRNGGNDSALVLQYPSRLTRSHTHSREPPLVWPVRVPCCSRCRTVLLFGLHAAPFTGERLANSTEPICGDIVKLSTDCCSRNRQCFANGQ